MFEFYGDINNRFQDGLETFLAAAEELKIRGLTSGEENKQSPKNSRPQPPSSRLQKKRPRTDSSASDGAAKRVKPEEVEVIDDEDEEFGDEFYDGDGGYAEEDPIASTSAEAASKGTD